MATAVIDKFDAVEWFSKPGRGLRELVELFMGIEYKGKEGLFPCLGFAMCLSSADRTEEVEAGYHYYGHAIDVEDPFREHGWFDPATTQINIQNVLNDLCRARVMVELIFDNRNYPHVQLDTVVSELWPDFVTSQASFTNAITVEDLIGHFSGLPDFPATKLGVASYAQAELDDVLTALRTIDIEIGHRQGYFRSDLNGYLAEQLINHLTGCRDESLREETCGWPVRVNVGQTERAKAYEYESTMFDDAAWTEVPRSPYTDTFATVRELHQLAENLFRPERGFTSKRKLAYMLKAGYPLDAAVDEIEHGGVGIGWYKDEKEAPGVKIVRRSVTTQGYGCVVFFIPKKKLVGVAIGTHDNAGSIGLKIADYIAKHITEGFPE